MFRKKIWSWRRSEPKKSQRPYGLPNTYEFLEQLSDGFFGKVLRCFCKVTNRTVVIKIPRKQFDSELAILEKLREEGLDQHNILTFHGTVGTSEGPALVFENLDLSLYDHIQKNFGKCMPLSDIRDIISQMAVALKALKSSEVVHMDIKPDNIMLVDETQPLKAKLIDFGLAMRSSSVRLGQTAGALCFSAPEVLLGLPITEASDMWSLGCVLFVLLYHKIMINSHFHSEIMKLMVEMLGCPPDELLEKGLYTEKFFTKTSSGCWRIKENMLWTTNEKAPLPLYLESCKKFREDNNDDPEEYQQCLDLLKAMLVMTASQRITPQEVLQHPFITQTSQQKSPPVSPSRVIMVQPARPEDTQELEDGDKNGPPLRKEVSEQPINTPRSSTSSDSLKTQVQHPSPIISTAVIAVQPAGPENTQELEEEDSQVQTERSPLKKDDRLRLKAKGEGLKLKEEEREETSSPRPAEGGKEKKKKSRWQRLKSWMRKKICCGCGDVL